MDDLFLNFSIEKLKQLEARIQECLRRLSDEQVWWRPSDRSNAVGNLIVHLCGNVGQWILAGLGIEPYLRQRDLEFADLAGLDKADLSEILSSYVQRATDVLRTIPNERLKEPFSVQGYSITVLEAIYHVVEHFSMHTGQILYITKLLTNQDLGFYEHLKEASHSERIP